MALLTVIITFINYKLVGWFKLVKLVFQPGQASDFSWLVPQTDQRDLKWPKDPSIYILYL